MRSRSAAGLCIALAFALAACSPGREEPAAQEQAPAPAAQESAQAADAAPAPEAGAPAIAEGAAPAQPGAPAPEKTDRWLLSEFDWGDSKDIVYESVHYADGFLCYQQKHFEHCAFVKAKVDGDELLAKFSFVEDALWRIDILTPDLDAEQADLHLERIWKLLASYVTRFKGEASEQGAFPARDSLAPKQEVVTHRWVLPDQEIRIVVGRSATQPKWYTDARFIDPKWAKKEPPPEEEPKQAVAPPPSQ